MCEDMLVLTCVHAGIYAGNLVKCLSAGLMKVQCYLEVGVERGAKACGHREAAQASKPILQDPVDAGCSWQ